MAEDINYLNPDYNEGFEKDEYIINTFKEGEERDKIISLFEDFRTEIYDFCPDKNILDDKKIVANSRNIHKYFKRAVRDLNSGTPLTKYEILDFPDTGLLIDGAVVFFLIANGLLQLRNQVSYSDAGLSISMFDKSSMYMSWVNMLWNMYMQGKSEFKKAETTRKFGAGIYGIGSEFGLMAGEWEDLW